MPSIFSPKIVSILNWSLSHQTAPNAMLRARLCNSPLFSLSVRCLSTTPVCSAYSRTKESRPIPGQPEHLKPLAWAERLFTLQAIRQTKMRKAKEAPESPPVHVEASTPPQSQPEPTEPPRAKSAPSGGDTEAAPQYLTVCRLFPWKGIPHYEKAMLTRYNMGEDTRLYSWRILRNSASVAHDLWKIKHLIRVLPLKLPQGLPTDNTNPLYVELQANGTLKLHPGTAVNAVPVDEAESTKIAEEQSKFDVMKLDRRYLRAWHNKRWDRFQLFSEYFNTHYHYEHNQDGMEYRYARFWRHDEAMKQSIKSKFNADGTYGRPEQRFVADWNTYPWRRY